MSSPFPTHIPHIILIDPEGYGVARETLLELLKPITAHCPVTVEVASQVVLDDIESLTAGIHGDLAEYIQYKFTIPKRKTFKTGGKSELMLVDNPDYFNEEGQYCKRRNPMKHLTPKKKKRK